MAALKETIIKALRLSSAAGTALSDEIDRNIKAARAEMIRVGVSADLAESEHVLIEEAIVTYSLMNMDYSDTFDRYQAAWLYQIDCLRKSSLKLPETEAVSNDE